MSEKSQGEQEQPLVPPPGAAVIHNPDERELQVAIVSPDDSELLERHGRHFHLIEGSHRTVIEVTHFVERRHGFFGKPHLEEDAPRMPLVNAEAFRIVVTPLEVSLVSTRHNRAPTRR